MNMFARNTKPLISQIIFPFLITIIILEVSLLESLGEGLGGSPFKLRVFFFFFFFFYNPLIFYFSPLSIALDSPITSRDKPIISLNLNFIEKRPFTLNPPTSCALSPKYFLLIEFHLLLHRFDVFLSFLPLTPKIPQNLKWVAGT
jgi:hypothetical protein